jgi:hypothetical protein
MAAPNDAPSPERGWCPTQAIIETIARHEGVDVTAVEPPTYDPLYTVVNPEALDNLFQTDRRPGEAPVRVSLEYAGYDIVVSGDGHVDVTSGSNGEVATDLGE